MKEVVGTEEKVETTNWQTNYSEKLKYQEEQFDIEIERMQNTGHDSFTDDTKRKYILLQFKDFNQNYKFYNEFIDWYFDYCMQLEFYKDDYERLYGFIDFGVRYIFPYLEDFLDGSDDGDYFGYYDNPWITEDGSDYSKFKFEEVRKFLLDIIFEYRYS